MVLFNSMTGEKIYFFKFRLLRLEANNMAIRITSGMWKLLVNSCFLRAIEHGAFARHHREESWTVNLSPFFCACFSTDCHLQQEPCRWHEFFPSKKSPDVLSASVNSRAYVMRGSWCIPEGHQCLFFLLFSRKKRELRHDINLVLQDCENLLNDGW